MDDGLASLACLMALSAVVASLVTWLLVRKADSQPGAILKKLRVRTQSDDEDSEESEVVNIELDTSRKYYVSSSGRKLHIYADCLGRHARVSHYKMCIHCANRFTDRPSTSTREATRRSKRSNSKRG